MSSAMPSLLALLGLAAVAGYQNRGKISEMVNDARTALPPSGQGTSGSTPGGMGHLFGSGDLGNTLSGGLSELVNAFKNAGQAPTANSWIAPGANMPVQSGDLESALGQDTLTELEQKTGLTRSELVRRLSATLPDIVNKLTPDGRIPTAAEAARLGQPDQI